MGRPTAENSERTIKELLKSSTQDSMMLIETVVKPLITCPLPISFANAATDRHTEHHEHFLSAPPSHLATRPNVLSRYLLVRRQILSSLKTPVQPTLSMTLHMSNSVSSLPMSFNPSLSLVAKSLIPKLSCFQMLLLRFEMDPLNVTSSPLIRCSAERAEGSSMHTSHIKRRTLNLMKLLCRKSGWNSLASAGSACIIAMPLPMPRPVPSSYRWVSRRCGIMVHFAFSARRAVGKVSLSPQPGPP